MRKRWPQQARLDATTISKVPLNLECRDELVPILRGIQEVFAQPKLRDSILDLIEQDVLAREGDAVIDRRTGREGMTYWELFVLSSVRLGCNLNYDKLQDLTENHISLRGIMGLGDWAKLTRMNANDCDFSWQRIRDNLCLLEPSTLEKINHIMVAAGHKLVPEASRTARADSFVIETNIHYPTESSLLIDGWEQIYKRAIPLVEQYQVKGWRQHEHLLKKAKRIARNIHRIAVRKGPHYQQRMRSAYQQLFKLTRAMVRRVELLCETIQKREHVKCLDILANLRLFLQFTQQVLGTAHRRVIKQETVPNNEKLFSMFEPHTQLYKRGKVDEPVQFGRQLLIYEDAAGFITHYHLLPREVGEKDVVVEQTQQLQSRLDGKLEELSLDRGFHSPDNQLELSKIVPHVCLPKPGVKQVAAQEEEADEIYHAAKQRHSGIEAAIGALQSGNGCVRCRDRSERGMQRYVALAVLGRNLHIFGKLLVARDHPRSVAGQSQRKSAA